MNAATAAAAWMAVAAVATIGVQVAVVRLRVWAQRGPRRDFCEVCGAKPRNIWTVTARFDDDDALGISDGFHGGTAMAATYCRDHRPAGARKRPNRR
jgi:hypothetical protein